MNTYIDLTNQNNLIEGVVLHPLKIHKDASGSLVETLRSDWLDVFNDQDLSFAMQYMSITPRGVIRDQDKWHVHNFQKDRFICVSGKIVTAIYDPRENSKTRNKLNLFLMGPEKEPEMYMVVIPEKTYHGFMVVSKEEGYLLNFPTKVYNPDDEGRIPNTQFDWNITKADFSPK